jgi:biotin-(acetyl-CoA carboxylase) ligase
VLGIGIYVSVPEQGYHRRYRGQGRGDIRKEIPPGIKSRLAAEVLKNFWQYYAGLGDRKYLSEYRNRSLITGRDIYILKNDDREKRMPRNRRQLSSHCKMRGRLFKALSSGEVSIRQA